MGPPSPEGAATPTVWGRLQCGAAYSVGPPTVWGTRGPRERGELLGAIAGSWHIHSLWKPSVGEFQFRIWQSD
ncbi:MAG: hypothetical protein F6J93_06205 [Oscillatoria sp. SIO1A7]|nr:hypothetical protein [Oscillatoria sp. SIO1A7]